ncbi:hypothetical protein K7432_015910, partial [Basidiobolus ranarum]
MPDLPSHSNEARAVGSRGNSFLRLFNPKILFRRRLVIFMLFSVVCLFLLYHSGLVESEKFNFHHSDGALVEQDEILPGDIKNASFVNEEPKLNNPADKLYDGLEHKKLSLDRQAKIRTALLSTWSAYFTHVLGQDEIEPVTKEGRQSHNGWGVTVVAWLDTFLVLSSQYVYI